MQFAGFWRRLGADLIDEIVVFVPIGFYFALFSFFSTLPAAAVGAGTAHVISILFYVLLPVIIVWPFFYFVFFEGRTGITWGKRIFRLKLVIREQPNRDGIGYIRSFLRLAIAAVLRYLLNLSFLWMLIDPEGRALHDYALGTIVVHDPSDLFPAFDPEKLPRRPKRVAWFVILLILSALPLIGLFLPAGRT